MRALGLTLGWIRNGEEAGTPHPSYLLMEDFGSFLLEDNSGSILLE